MRRPVFKTIAAASVAAVAAVGIFVAVSANAEPASPYSRNANGQTYGSALDALTPDDEPDLIQAVATNGQRGYVLRTELEVAASGNVRSPQEALAWQAENEGKDSLVTVYESDGLTKVGTFVVHHPSAAERAAADAWAATQHPAEN